MAALTRATELSRGTPTQLTRAQIITALREVERALDSCLVIRRMVLTADGIVTRTLTKTVYLRQDDLPPIVKKEKR